MAHRVPTMALKHRARYQINACSTEQLIYSSCRQPAVFKTSCHTATNSHQPWETKKIAPYTALYIMVQLIICELLPDF